MERRSGERLVVPNNSHRPIGVVLRALSLSNLQPHSMEVVGYRWELNPYQLGSAKRAWPDTVADAFSNLNCIHLAWTAQYELEPWRVAEIASLLTRPPKLESISLHFTSSDSLTPDWRQGDGNKLVTAIIEARKATLATLLTESFVTSTGLHEEALWRVTSHTRDAGRLIVLGLRENRKGHPLSKELRAFKQRVKDSQVTRLILVKL